MTFRESQVHNGIMANVKGAIKDKKSLPDSKAYGKKLIIKTIRDPEFKADLKDFSLKIVKHPELKSTSGTFVRQVIVDPFLKADMGSMISKVMTSGEISAKMEGMLSLGATHTVGKPEFMQHFGAVFFRTMMSEEVWWECINSMVISNIFTFRKRRGESSIKQWFTRNLNGEQNLA